MATRPSIFPLTKSGSLFWLKATGVVALLFACLTAVARSAHGEQFWPHAFCYLWNPWLLRYNLWSDALIAASYLSISLTLVYLVRQAKREIPFHWMFIAFGTFILACGATHAMEVLTLYKPYYWMAVEVKVITAVASVMTAIALPPLVPKIKAMLTEAAMSGARAAALMESEAKFRSIYEGVRVGITVENLDGWVLDANPELQHMLQTPAEHLRKLSFADFCDAASSEAERPLKARLKAGDLQSYEIDKNLRRSDGSMFPAHVTVTRVTGPLGGQSYVIAIMEDISERIAQQEREKQLAAFAAGEQRTRELSEALPALIWTCSADGICDYVNERWMQFTGKEVAELLGLGWLRCVHPEDRERVNERWERSVRDGSRYELEFRVRRKDGEYRWFFTRGVPIKTTDNSVVRWIGACVDVHEQKATHDILRRTERLAATGSLAATIAHEINNPLEAITNIVFLLQTGKSLPAEYRPLVDDAARELERVSHIVKHSLAFYRDTSKPTPVRVSHLVRETLDLYRSRALAKQVELQCEGDSEVAIMGYPGELRQVFSNIVVNAIDAVPNAGRVRVRVREVRDGVRVTISDSGAGISESVRTNLFSPFVTTKGEKGTGLGLWVSQGIVAKHMGSISVVSSTRPQFHGTTFSVFLPAQNELLLTTAYPQAAKA